MNNNRIHPREKVFLDYNKYVAICKSTNTRSWNMSDERNFYSHFTYLRKRSQ